MTWNIASKVVIEGSVTAAYGGRYLARGGSVETLEGSWLPSRLVILEFPTVELGRALVAGLSIAPR